MPGFLIASNIWYASWQGFNRQHWVTPWVVLDIFGPGDTIAYPNGRCSIFGPGLTNHLCKQLWEYVWSLSCSKTHNQWYLLTEAHPIHQLPQSPILPSGGQKLHSGYGWAGVFFLQLKIISQARWGPTVEASLIVIGCWRFTARPLEPMKLRQFPILLPSDFASVRLDLLHGPVGWAVLNWGHSQTMQKQTCGQYVNIVYIPSRDTENIRTTWYGAWMSMRQCPCIPLYSLSWLWLMSFKILRASPFDLI